MRSQGETMKKLALLAGLSLVLAASAARAQNAADDPADAERSEPRRTIRVLEDPYDIASFYRSPQGSGYFDEASVSERYPIAGYYRNRPSGHYGYSRFWTNGYGYSRRPLAGGVAPYWSSIGQNGDLCLMAPTFLASVGPLTGVFFSLGR
jgi:hypothetical protein